MLLIPGLPLSPEGPRRGHLFSFYLLNWCHMASLDCLQGAGVFFSLTHSLVSVLVLLLCFSTAWLECGGGQREDTGQVVLLPLLAYWVWKELTNEAMPREKGQLFCKLPEFHH